MGGVLFTVAILLVVLGFLVFIHELGHYWAAKAFGVWVHRFAVGMGSPVKRLSFQRGETEWAIAWLPLGGYVKMASREEDPASGVLEGGAENAVVPPDRVFEAKPVWQRMVIILAGVTVNLIFAWLVFVGLAWKNGRTYDPTTTLGRISAAVLPAEASGLLDVPRGSRIVSIDGRKVESWTDVQSFIGNGRGDTITFAFDTHSDVKVALHPDQLVERSMLAVALEPLHRAVIGEVVSGSAADSGGLEPGDTVLAVNGSAVEWWSDLTAVVEPSAGQDLALSIKRGDEMVDLVVTPRAEHATPGDSSTAMVGRIGVRNQPPFISESYSLGGAIAAGTGATWNAAGTIVRTVRGLLTRRIASNQVGGPILIGQMAADSARLGIDALLAFMALISVNLAVVNLLPIPVLDGGAFLILAVEAVIRRPLPVRLREVIQVIGLLMVVALMVLAFSNDIRRLLGM
ncbi:MAG TPA: RIP metalloprotease RseP [Gemmatimonadales bacterium]|nr:RIP metalloprotease RseP [Gemmatimonadales bacterium]